jgi:myo-inositol-1(or 4)-monophosphatase
MGSGQVVDIETVIEVAQAAGHLILQMRSDGLRNVRSKASVIDLVTEADVAAEKLIRDRLYEKHAEIGFWGEESNQVPREELFWVVDPIDGTTNYANGLPFFAVNIALYGHNTGLLGVTLELPAWRVYWAQAGRGAYVREKSGKESRLSVNGVEELDAALLSTGFPYHRAEHSDNNGAEHTHFLARAQGVRCTGSAALDLVYVATGALAGYWESWLSPWDAAPGALLVREAGGRVSDYEGNEWTLTCNNLVASNGRKTLHQALVEGISQARTALTEPY